MCFWIFLCNDDVHFNSFVRDWLLLPSRLDVSLKRRAKISCLQLGVRVLCLALCIDFDNLKGNS